MTSTTPLDWFPKRFSEGDMDGSGARRLLGVPNISPTDVLVRETAQNSWDARDSAPAIVFTIDLRTLIGPSLETLRDVVFSDGADVVGLRQLLEGPALRVIEIGDRGTAGLDGPTRNDRAFDANESRNFVDLVFHLGAPRDVDFGGGTYGFGKTIAYIVSSVATVVFWTRCRTERGFEDRLIGSAMGDAFDLDGYRYTGRQWWGREDEGRIYPVCGPEASEIAQAVFGGRFAPNETGTSILILDPQLDADTDAEIIDDLREAILWNLWPKMVPEAGRGQMRIELKHDGAPVTLPDAAAHAEVGPFVECLSAVRALQAGSPPPDSVWPMETFELHSQKPPRALGTLALTRRPVKASTSRTDSESRMHHIALMRTEAELVVKYDEHRPMPDSDFRWVGVFKPTLLADDSFAAAEPPAHDDWIVSGIQDKAKRRDVNVALREMRQRVNQFVAPSQVASTVEAEAVSAASLGNRLAGLLVGLPGSAASPAPATSSGSRRPGSPRPRLRLVPSPVTPAAEAGWNSLSLKVGLDGAGPDGELVAVTVGVGYDGGMGTADVSDWVRTIGWLPDNTTDPITVYSDIDREYVVEFRRDVAVDIDARVVTE